MTEFVTRYFARLVPECDPTTTCDASQLKQLVVNVIQFLINTSLLIAVVFIMWGGLLILTAGGSSDRMSKGKKSITAAIFGIVIVLVAMSAIKIFLELFTSCSGDWWNFQPLTC